MREKVGSLFGSRLYACCKHKESSTDNGDGSVRCSMATAQKSEVRNLGGYGKNGLKNLYSWR